MFLCLCSFKKTIKENNVLNLKLNFLFSYQCYNVPRMSVLDFANQICERAKKFDSSILGEGLQVVSENPEQSCRVFCTGKNGKPVTKSWTFPDGTICRNQNTDIDDSFFCVNGRCEVRYYFLLELITF